MKKIIIPLALVLGAIASEVKAQTFVVRSPVRRVVVVRPVVIAPRPAVFIPRPVRVIPAPVVIAPRPIVVKPAPAVVQAAPVSPPPSTTVVRKKTVIHKL